MREPDPTVTVLQPRRGRPPAAEAQVPISTRLPAADYDRLARLAVQHDIPLAALVRQVLVVSFRIE